jgi:hypothetical protein
LIAPDAEARSTGRAIVDILRSAVIGRDLAALVPWVPAAAVALVIAETLYKFRSFTLECLAFVATAIVLQVVFRAVLALVGSRDGPGGPASAA